MARSAYCNATTDLTDIDPNIRELQELIPVINWVQYSSTVWYATKTGYISVLFQDGTPLTSQSSIGALTTSSFYYNADIDTLYIRTSTSANPSNFTIEYGIDWDSYLLALTKKAADYLDSRLRVRFPTPIPKSIDIIQDITYDYVIVRLNALLTLYLLKSRDDMEVAKKYKEDADSLIKEILDGKTKLSFEFTAGQIGTGVISPTSTNTSTLVPFISGLYVGDTGIWYLKCTTIGAVGTAQYKLSDDNGVTYPYDAVVTDVELVSLSEGLYVRWLNRNDESPGALVLNDTWKIKVTSNDETVKTSKLTSIGIKI